MPAKSKQQQKFMGIVKAIQQGDEPASKFSKSAQDAAEDMKEKDVEDFASTKHKGLPKKVEQYLRQKIRKEITQMISVKEAFTGGDRKILFVIARELADNLKKVGLKGKQLERVMSSAILSMRYDKSNLNYKKFKRFFPRGYNSKLVKRLLDKFHDQYDAVRWTFIRQAIGESVNEVKGVPNKMRANFIKLRRGKQGLSYEESRELYRVYKDITELLTYGKFYDKGKPNKRRYELSALVADINTALIGTKRIPGGNQQKFERIFKKFANMINTQFKAEEKGRTPNYRRALKASQLDLVKKLFKNAATYTNVSKQSDLFKDSVNERDYKEEYKKYGSSTKAKKYRAELNQYNRKNGTYGNGDGKDASHKGGKIVGFEKESTNRGRAEKSRLKKKSVNERVSHSEAKVILSQLGGSKFIAMTGAKNFGVGNTGLSMSIGKNSKRITHFIVDYNRGKDLYNLEFVRLWGGKRISVKKLKSVYFDDLQYHFKKYTGLNTRL